MPSRIQKGHFARKSTPSRAARVKNDSLKIVESALKREQDKEASRARKKHAKKAVAKKPDDDDSSDESVHYMEKRIPRKKTRANRTIRMNSRGQVVDMDISDSEEDRKMPAKSNKKKAPKLVIEQLDSESSSDEEMDNKPTKEERAFLKSIDKKEREDKLSDSE